MATTTINKRAMHMCFKRIRNLYTTSLDDHHLALYVDMFAKEVEAAAAEFLTKPLKLAFKRVLLLHCGRIPKLEAADEQGRDVKAIQETRRSILAEAAEAVQDACIDFAKKYDLVDIWDDVINNRSPRGATVSSDEEEEEEGDEDDAAQGEKEGGGEKAGLEENKENIASGRRYIEKHNMYRVFVKKSAEQDKICEHVNFFNKMRAHAASILVSESDVSFQTWSDQVKSMVSQLLSAKHEQDMFCHILEEEVVEWGEVFVESDQQLKDRLGRYVELCCVHFASKFKLTHLWVCSSLNN